MKIIAMIPVRLGSKRVPRKNFIEFNLHTISPAIDITVSSWLLTLTDKRKKPL